MAERVVGVDGPFRGAGDVGGAGDLVAYAGEAADVDVLGRYGGEGLAGDALVDERLAELQLPARDKRGCPGGRAGSAGGAVGAAWADDHRNHGAAKVGMVFQSYNLWPHMNVLDNLVLAPRKILGLSASEAEARAEKALAEVGMAEHIRSRSTQLSGGERQRVAIARALMMRPQVLLCDEITSALDPPVAAEVLGVLARLKQEEGLAVVLVTHDMAFASKAADRVVFFSNGRIAVDSTPEKAFHQCDHPELKAFVDAVRID